MNYIDIIADKQDLVSPGLSFCQGCGAELIVRRVLKAAGENSIVCIPPGCAAGAGIIGWNFDAGMKLPVHMPLLDNTASFMTGVTQMYQRRGREDVNLVCIAGDGATADCGFQSLSGAAERGEKMLYVCYDNEGYMNTGFQRSSTTSLGSRTSTTPIGSKIKGKTQQAKNLPFIMAMHNAEYVATASPSHMKDMMEKIEKGLAASKRGFAYLHIFSACPTGWLYGPQVSVEVSRKAVQSDFFPLYEVDRGVWKETVVNKKPTPLKDFLALSKKFAKLTPEDAAALEEYVANRRNVLNKMAG